MSRTEIIGDNERYAPHGDLGALALGALGVVYGDIGTSPLYTMKTALEWGGGATPEVAIGMLSLIVWTLLITTSIKYVAVVMRADNDGEGGILALMSLLGIKRRQSPRRDRDRRAGRGTALWRRGDNPGNLGVERARRTQTAGAVDRTLRGAALGRHPCRALRAPAAGHRTNRKNVRTHHDGVVHHDRRAWARRRREPPGRIWSRSIRATDLPICSPTDLPAFWFSEPCSCAPRGQKRSMPIWGTSGLRPIRFAWYGLVLPMLLLNYAGQAAAVVEGAVATDANPFFVLCPAPLQVPLVVLATLATIIASQAIISGAFSMTRQAIQLGLCPRLHITQTSAEGYGQIYVGFVNWVLMALTLGLTLAFRSSENLAAAFGVAVSLTMLLTSMLMFLTMREIWNWSLPVSLAVAGLFIVVDLSFVMANLMKVFEGGFVPLVIAALIFFLIWTWRRGREAMLQKLERDTLPLADFIRQIGDKSRVPGTAVYLTSRTDVVPVPLLHNLKHNKVIHQRIVLLHVVTENVPRIAADQRIQVTHLMDNFHSVVVHYGFMEQPDIPQVLDACGSQQLHFDLMETSFFVGRLTIVPASASRLSRLRTKLFEAMHRNALAATEFFRIPPNRVIELGGQIEI